MTAKVTITRRSRIGFGYTAGAVNGPSGLYIPLPAKPDYIGTVKQIEDILKDDRTYQSLQNGSTYYSECYFALVDGEWKRIKKNYGFETPAYLLRKHKDSFDDVVFDENALTFQVE